ncbi:MAG: oligosaccharide flippase family protein [Candidatus Marinimicrobia bacterium]|nr:oligosaccharide flippase family protein [Candidatus Neomarinimicrobiota bacterium]
MPVSNVGTNIRRMSKHTAVYGVGNILNRAITFLLLPLYTNILTTADYGVLNLIYPFLGLMNVVFMYGMDSAFMRFFIPEKDEKRRSEVFSTVYISILGSTAVFTGLLFLLEPVLARSILGNDNNLLYLAFVILALDGLSFLPVLYFRSVNKPVNYVAIIFGEVLLNLSLNILFVAVFRWGIRGVLLANICSSTLKLLLASPALLHHLKRIFIPPLWRDILKFGLPTVPAVLFANIIALGDKFILRYFFDESTVGIYAASYKIAIIMALFVTAFRFAWHPFFLSISDQPDAKQTYSKILTLFVMVAAFLFLLVSLLAPPILTTPLFGVTIIPLAYQAGLKVIPWVLAAYIFQGMYVNLVVGVYLEKKTHLSPLFTGIGMMVNLGTNFFLLGVLKMDFIAAGIAALLGNLAQTIAIFIATRRFYPIRYEYEKLLLIGAISLVLFLTPRVTGLEQFWFLALLVLLYFPLLFRFHIIDRQVALNLAKRVLKRH